MHFILFIVQPECKSVTVTSEGVKQKLKNGRDFIGTIGFMKTDISLEREAREFPKAAECLCSTPDALNSERSLPYP